MNNTINMLCYEQQCIDKGDTLIAGIDEAGRGPLAGPVVVASVIMPLDNIIDGVNDSKKLSATKRNKLYPLILEQAIDYHIAVVNVDVIDTINILNATKHGMLECIDALDKVDTVLIDAVKVDTCVNTISIIKGDSVSYSIACASILAKVYRDNIMLNMHELYPQYGFDKHKGYGTAQHITALKQHGKCAIHRDTFIKNFV